MKIAIASGKGGTGKTTIATNLARVASDKGQSVAYLDCDVEEPNGHIFLKPEIEREQSVISLIPEVDEGKCIHCGKCGEICRYSAIVCIKDKVLVYPELCHSCGGCALVCPTGAITEKQRQTGVVQIGKSDSIDFVHGISDLGVAVTPPLVRAVKRTAQDADIIIIDAPPGTSCPVIESVREVDYVVLVTEPTPFGLNDLKLAVEMSRTLGLRFAVVVNRVGIGDDRVHRYCKDEGIEILQEIPDDRKIAQAYSRGMLACEVSQDYRKLFEQLLDRINNNMLGLRGKSTSNLVEEDSDASV